MKTLKHKNKKTRVFVGLSGGVDSSVAAALLKQQGYDVTGIFIKIWDEQWGNCTWPEERRDAMKVAMQLGVPFKTFDLSEKYKKDVVNYMVREYKLGRTPNPDVMCNARIKFGKFLEWSLKQGADFVATGHYVRLTHNAQRITQKITNNKFNTKYRMPDTKYYLLKGVDDNKDQSYFLWQLKQSQLKHCIFPIGEYKKSEVRELARKFGLPNAEKKDSQGICFVGKVGLKEFLKKYLPPKRGDVLRYKPAQADGRARKGEVIGYHDGAFFLTIGQRHGFTITKKTPNDAPFYIVGKDMKRNVIVVANCKRHEIASPTARNDIIIYKVNWIREEPKSGKKYRARFRHLQPLLNCSIVKLLNNECEIKFGEPLEGVAAGQSLVLYDGEICLGGGIIK